MSTIQTAATSPKTSNDFVPPPYEQPHVWRQIEDLVAGVADTIAPVWPLKDYVAVNPYAGISDRRFLAARSFLRIFSDCETLMPLEHYVDQFQRGQFWVSDIDAAIEELKSTGVEFADGVSGKTVADQLRKLQPSRGGLDESPEAKNAGRRIHAISEFVDRQTNSDWTGIIRDEISKFCGSHYDEGQATWRSPWKDLPLFQAWRTAAEHDRNVEILGLKGFRCFVSRLPHTPEAAIVHSLQWLGVPQRLWEPFLLCQAFTIPGWSAWAKYQVSSTETDESRNGDLTGLLAMRLAYDAALSEPFGLSVNWGSIDDEHAATFCGLPGGDDDNTLIRYTLLRASEIGYRNTLLDSLASNDAPSSQQGLSLLHANNNAKAAPARKLAQMVFCIDVRSEPMRRQIESLTGEIETIGFAGFFGMPIEFVQLGDSSGNRHLPVLLEPQFQLHEGLRKADADVAAASLERRSQIRTMRQAWNEFQTSAVGCFSLVETTGLLYGVKLLARALGMGGKQSDRRLDGIAPEDAGRLGPTLRGLNQQGITTSCQADLAESMLTGMGLTRGFARLVVFCGHASKTENNPLQAGLDCGACGGHSGEPNARLAAMLLNQSYIRQALAERGIEIPEDTHFLAGLHNTTTDQIEYFDVGEAPESHQGDIQELIDRTNTAAKQARRARMGVVASKTEADLMRRSGDWSEVRPEWGLAGNAAFIAARRELTDSANLDGRAFLHSYDHHSDPAGKVLEQIMTAPMVVAHWINMQYYASTVDNRHFGSGNKTIHNVVGRFGILSGNDGDLTTGLPWQSLHTGETYQHLPLRLLAVLAAPRDAIEAVIAKHPMVENLLTGGWLHLVALEDQTYFRYTENQTWQAVTDPLVQPAATR